MIDFGYVSFRTVWIYSSFSRVKVCVVVGYGTNEGDNEEWDRLWNNMDRILDRDCAF